MPSAWTAAAYLDCVLDSFLEEDEAEQRETFEYLKRALDETRAAHGERPLFPNE